MNLHNMIRIVYLFTITKPFYSHKTTKKFLLKWSFWSGGGIPPPHRRGSGLRKTERTAVENVRIDVTD